VRWLALAGALVALAAPARAAAGIVSFATGEEFVEPQSADFSRSAGAYWTDHRDLRPYTPALWRLLRRHHATLAVHLRYERDFGPVPAGRTRHADVMPILRGARRHHVPIDAWLVVPYADGYWAHDGDAQLQAAAVDAYFPWAARHHVRARSVLLDLESSLQDTRTISHLRDDPVAVAALLRRNVHPDAQCAAARSYAGTVRAIRAHGLRATAAAYSFVLDDVSDGDVALSDGLNAPLFVPGEFADVGFMTMRSVLAQELGIDPGTSILGSYQQSIDRWFGGAGALDLGVAGTPPYDHLPTLLGDVRAAATVSREPIGMYSLETVWKSFGFAGVRAVVRAAGQPLHGPAAAAVTTTSPAAQSARAYVDAEDASIAAGTPLAELSRGAPPRAPDSWPPTCRVLG
jgi:hypothetical protein